MSDVVRVRIGGVEKNLGRAFAVASDNVVILVDEETHRLDGQQRSDEDVLRDIEGAGKAALEAEVERRNSTRAEDDALNVKKGTVKDLEAALLADDKARLAASDSLRASELAAMAAAEAATDGAGDTADDDSQSGAAGDTNGGTQ